MTRSMEVRHVLQEEILDVVAKALAFGEMPDLAEYSSDDVFHAFQPGFVGLCQRDINPIWLGDLIFRIAACRGPFILKWTRRHFFDKPVRGTAFYGELVGCGGPIKLVMITPTSSPITYDATYVGSYD